MREFKRTLRAISTVLAITNVPDAETRQAGDLVVTMLLHRLVRIAKQSRYAK
jgi:hypothetical protein